MKSLRIVREGFLRTSLFAGSAIILPYSIWDYLVERGSFSRAPVTVGILLLGVVTFLIYFSTTIRFDLHFSWRRAVRAALLFALLGVGFVAVLSIMLFSYLCEVIARRRARLGLPRPSFSPNLGVLFVLVQAFLVFPLLNEMYCRGTQAKMWHPDYNRRNIFYDINADGFRGPRVPLERAHSRRIMFIGDSSPFGFAYRWEEAFPAVVENLLKRRGFDVEVVNAATIGQSDGEIRLQLPYLLRYRPDVVFVMTGIHYRRADSDYRRILREGVSRETGWRPFVVVPPLLVEVLAWSVGSSPLLFLLHLHLLQPPLAERAVQDERDLASFTVQLRAVVLRIRASGAHLYLVDYPTPGAERRVEAAVRRVAAETGTDFIPLFDLIGNQIKAHLHDPVHPDREGHRLIAERLAFVAADALRSPLSPPTITQLMSLRSNSKGPTSGSHDRKRVSAGTSRN